MPRLAFLLLAVLSFAQICATEARADATIFIYHRFGESAHPSTNTDTARFREQMRYLADHGYRVVPLATIVEHVKKGETPPDKTVAITIDDGFLSTYTVAWPILRALGFPFTVFVYAEACDKGYKDFMSWEQMREMARAGVDFQNHGYGHLRFGTRKPGMQDDAYRAWIREDFQKGAALLTRELGKSPALLSLPYGEYNRLVMEEVKALGVTAAFTQDPGAVSGQTDPLFIPREPVVGDDWSSMKHFTEVLGRLDLPLAPVTLENLQSPELASRGISVRVLFPERYLPQSYGVYISEFGWQKPAVAGERVTARIPKPFTRRSDRFMLSARDKTTGRMAVRFWQLFRDP